MSLKNTSITYSLLYSYRITCDVNFSGPFCDRNGKKINKINFVLIFYLLDPEVLHNTEECVLSIKGTSIITSNSFVGNLVVISITNGKIRRM